MTDSAEFKEKLEAAHEFPCNYTFKLFGPNEPSFKEAALGTAKRHLPDVSPQTSSRVTGKANHQCLTMELPVLSAQQVVDLYEDFHKLDGLKMLL